MKEKTKSVGDWLKDKTKKITFKKSTKEDVYDIVYRVEVIQRNENEKLKIELESEQKTNTTLRDYVSELLERENEAIKKADKFEKDLSLAKVTIQLQNKKIEELESDLYLRKPVKEAKTPKAEPMKIKSGAKTSRIIKKVKEGK